MPMNRNRIMPGIKKLSKGVPRRMLVFSFISAPSGDAKSIAPLINPPVPIKINNSRNAHNENGAALFDFSKIFSLFFFVPGREPRQRTGAAFDNHGYARCHWCHRKLLQINHILITTAIKLFSVRSQICLLHLEKSCSLRHYRGTSAWEG